MSVIDVKSLAKDIKGKRILEDISFQVEEGECLALIGPNGAGKTTLMSILLGDRPLTKGEVVVLGKKAGHESLNRSISLLPQENQLPASFKVKELIAFYRSIYDEPLSEARIQDYLGFDPGQMELLTSKLSGGQKRLLSFVLTLIGRPSLLFLDEPTSAMDTATRIRFWKIIEGLKATGMSIVYTSHYIEEIEQVADRLLVLHKGALVKDTTPYALKQEEQVKAFTLPLRYASLLKGLEGIEALKRKEDVLIFETSHPDAVWATLSQAGVRLMEVEISNRSLLHKIFEEGE